MLKNKILRKKIRNIIILIMTIIVIIGTYKYINRSKAEDLIEIDVIAIDNYGYLGNEELKLQARHIENELYEVEIPENIYNKKLNKVEVENVTDEDAQKLEELKELANIENNKQEESAQNGEQNTENVQENQVKKIYLTKDQIERGKVNLKVTYDVAILETNKDGEYNKTLLSEKTEEEISKIKITEETKILHNKTLKYEDVENGKLVEVKGFLPADAELQVEEVPKSKLTELLKDKKIKVAYDIKIIQNVITEVPGDEANPEAEPTQIAETIEINPEDFGEICEVSIKDANIAEKSKVYHIKDDNILEHINIKENTEGNVSFDAKSFSVYAVGDDVVDPDGGGTETGSHPYQTRIDYETSSGHSGSLAAVDDGQYHTITVPYGGYVTVKNKTYNASSICVVEGGGNCDGEHVSSADLYPGYWGVYGYSGSGHTQGTYSMWITVEEEEPPSLEVNTTSCGWRNSSLSLRISVYSDNGLSSSNSYQYYLSTSSTALSGGSWTTYSRGSSFSINPASGTYYMFVKRVKDGNGASSISNGTNVTVSSTKYHRFGPYRFDKIAPTMSVSTQSCSWRNSALSTTINITDTGGSGLSSSNSYQYYLSTSSTALSGGSWKNYTNGTAISLNPGVSGTYYLFVKRARDNAGNITTTSGTATTISGTTYQRFGAFQFDYNKPTITVNTASCNWRNQTLSVTLTTSETGGSGLSANNSYQYYLSNSSTALSGGSWKNYTSNVAFSLNPGVSGRYYLFVKRINDNAGNTSTTNGTATTISGTTYQRFGEYRFDYEAPVWTTQNLVIDKEKDKLTVDIVGTDALSGIAASSLKLEDIKVSIDGIVNYSLSVTLGDATTISGGIKHQLILSNLEDVARQVGKEYKEWSGNITITIPAETLRDNAGNQNIQQNLSLGHVDTVEPDFRYIYSEADIDQTNKTLTVVFSTADKFFKDSSLTVNDLTILVDGKEPEWRTGEKTTGVTKEFTKVRDIIADVNGTDKVVGKEYTLVLSNLEQGNIGLGDNYLNYSGFVTIAIPANKVSDTSDNMNLAQTITVGVDINEQYRPDTPIEDITKPTYIPDGYTHVEGTTMENGYVIKDPKGNEYVWIEIPRTTDVYKTAGLNIQEFTEEDYNQIYKDLETYTLNVRIYSVNDNYGTHSGTETGLTKTQYNTQKKKMLKSIYKNGGFYVGRYETGTETPRNSSGETTQIPVIKKNVYPYYSVTVAQAQKLSSEFTSDLEGYTSSLMFGLQRNLISKYMNTKGVTVEELKNDSTGWGNYNASTFEISNTNAKYYNSGWEKVTGTISKSKNSALALTTGASEAFCKQNIYDLAGNYAEWSLEYGNDNYPVSAKGGNYYSENQSYNSFAYGSLYAPNASGNLIGFRVSLYKDEGIGSEIVSKEPYIPTGYTHVSGTTMENGYVVQDAKGNQYVWIEVPRIPKIYEISGVNITKFTNNDYSNIEEDLNRYVSTYKNGTVFSDKYSGNQESTGLTESQYNTQKKKMLKSIYKNEGFYIGRYETGIEDSYRTASGSATQQPVIKQNAYPYNHVTNTQAQTLASSFSSDGYSTSLMFGVQWDLTLKYLQNKGMAVRDLNVDGTNIGNYRYTLFNITNPNGKYSTDRGKNWLSTPYNKTETIELLTTTGTIEEFTYQNISDISGSLWEFTLEYTGNTAKPCSFRGGAYKGFGSTRPASYRHQFETTYASDDVGFRVSLYKDEGTGADPVDPDVDPDEKPDKEYAKPSELFDKEGKDPNKLHIGDFIEYDAGIWTQEEIDEIKTGEKSNLVTANGSTALPDQAFQFGGFTAGSSRNGNATQSSLLDGIYNYVKDKDTGKGVTGWRVFDVEGDIVTLISAGTPEDYYHPYVSGQSLAYVSEYILTGNINSNWANGATESEKYQKRDWSKYANRSQKAESARPLTKNILDKWYTKYTGTPNADIYDDPTFLKIYQEPYLKYQNMVENFSFYWLSAIYNANDVCYLSPNDRSVQTRSNEGLGVRLLVSLTSEIKFTPEKIGTKTVTGGNMTQYGGDQTYNVWGIEENKSSEPVIVDVVDPKIEKVKSEVNITKSEDVQTSTAQITFRATDKYFGTSSITAENLENTIKVIVDGVEVTEGITKILNTVTILEEERQVNGVNTPVQYGEEYTITIKGFTQNANQVKILIPKGVFIDQYKNDNENTEFILYNVLKPTNTEREGTSAFLGESIETTLYPTNIENLTTIKRQDIEKVEFVNEIPSTETQGIQRVWDVSAQNDRTILAWTFNTTAPYTIYIGSESDIYANQNSSYLFSYIGYTQGEEVIKNINLLNTVLVTNMEGMFAYCGYSEMTSLNLGDNFKTNSVTSMEGMFANTGYMAMTSLKLGDKFDTKSVTNMKNMFLNCGYTAMTSLDLNDKFDTKNAKDMSSMFENCGYTAMKFLDLGPLFTKIAYENKKFMINCGTSDIVIYAPESIYLDIKTFKINKTVH